MSNQQWPGHPGGRRTQETPGQSPWANPDPRWAPQSYRDVQARDPRQPFGTPQKPADQEQPRIEDYEPPRTNRPKLFLAGLAILVAIALLLAALQLFGGDSDQPATDAAARPSAARTEAELTPDPAATGGTSIPFEGNGTGIFDIVSQEWTASGLEVTVRVTVDSGERSFGLYMFNNATMEVADAWDPTPFYASPDQPAVHTATFPVDRAPSTLVLSSGFGRALTALPIKG